MQFGWLVAGQQKAQHFGFVIFLKRKSKINASSSHIKWSVGDNEIQCVGLAEKSSIIAPEEMYPSKKKKNTPLGILAVGCK